MKLASLKSGRDGRLVVVSRDLRRAVEADRVAPTLQAALDDWPRVDAPLRALADALEHGSVDDFPFDETVCASPLPRAYQWLDGSAYVNHVELLRRSRNRSLPDRFWTDPLMYQGGSDGFLPPRDPLPLADAAWGLDFEAEVAIVTDDVPAGTPPDAAAGHILLYMLANDVSLRRLIPDELAKEFGFLQGKPASSFAPVAVTPDELGEHRVRQTLALPLSVDLNGEAFGRARPDVDQVFDFAELIAHAAKTRALGAGTIIGGGTVSNRLDGGPGKPVKEGGAGYSCIAEQRAVEAIRGIEPLTPFLKDGDRIAIEVRLEDGSSLFGRIEHTVVTAAQRN